MVFQPTGSYIAKVFKLWLFSYTLLFLTKVTIKLVRCIALRTLAFRGEEAEPPRRFAPAGSQPFLYLPQESSVLRSIPLIQSKATIFKKTAFLKYISILSFKYKAMIVH